MILILGATKRGEKISVLKIQYNIVTHCSPLKNKCDQIMIAGGHILTDMAAFLEEASQDPRNALNSVLGVYPTDPLVAVPVGAHLPRQIQPNALLSNASSILNYSQARVVGLRNTYALPRAAADAVIEMVSDPKFVPREIGTKYVKRLKKKLKDALEAMFLFSTCMRKWTASKTSACFSVASSMLLNAFWRRGLCRLHGLYISSVASKHRTCTRLQR